MLDKNGKVIPYTEGKLARWNEYIQELFDDDRQQEIVKEDTESVGLNNNMDEVMQTYQLIYRSLEETTTGVNVNEIIINNIRMQTTPHLLPN